MFREIALCVVWVALAQASGWFFIWLYEVTYE